MDVAPPASGRIVYDGKEMLKTMMMAGVQKMVVPTIIQASCGGFITIIDGVGVYASTTLQEAFDFAAVHAEKKFGAKATVNMNDLPKFMQPGVWERAKRSMGVGVLASLAIGLAFWGSSGRGANERPADEYSHPAARAWRNATNPDVYQGMPRDERPLQEWSFGVPEVDVRKVQTESYGERSQSSISVHAPRRVRPHQ